MLKAFKAFALKGNMIDMAVGIVIGTAFGKIITSLVNDIIMPPIGMLLGKVDFSDLAFVLQEKTEQTATVTLNYGLFINTLLNFFIIAFSIFIVINQLNKLKKKEEKAPTEKDCPQCCSKVALAAKRCPHCTSVLE